MYHEQHPDIIFTTRCEWKYCERETKVSHENETHVFVHAWPEERKKKKKERKKPAIVLRPVDHLDSLEIPRRGTSSQSSGTYLSEAQTKNSDDEESDRIDPSQLSFQFR